MNKDLERHFDRAMISMGNKGMLMKIGTLQGKGIAVRGNYAATSEIGGLADSGGETVYSVNDISGKVMKYRQGSDFNGDRNRKL